MFPFCLGEAVGVIAVDFGESVELDPCPFSTQDPKDLTEEPNEVFSEARKGFDMSRALVNSFLSLDRLRRE